MNFAKLRGCAWAALPFVLLSAMVPEALAEPLSWDALSKRQTAGTGKTNIHFAFSVTNTAAEDVVIHVVRPSCGCTTARLPPLPWRLAPGRDGQIEATVDIHGKHGTVSKIITVESSAGTNYLTLVITIPPNREENQRLALADRQAVFKGECASCHVQPVLGQTGAALYTAACGICHESEHRATMVPNLKALGKPTDRDYWDAWIRKGKAGSLMPAFAKAEGGPLDDEQIKSLVGYLASQREADPKTTGQSAAKTH